MMVPAVITFLILKNYDTNKEKIFSYSIVAFLFLFISTTFLVGLILSLFFIFFSNFNNIKNNKKIALVTLILISIIIILSNKQCNMRFNETVGMSLINLKSFFYKNESIKKEYKDTLDHGTLNLSSEVFTNSLNISAKSFKSHPFGLGLNNYNLAHERYSEKFLSDSHLLNKNDASNNFVKIIVEFGLFSILLFFLIIKFSIKNLLDLPHKSFFISIIITQLIRGAGYFNGSFLLCILIIFLYSLNDENV